MALAIAIGAAAGVLGFLPLLNSLRMARNVTPTSNLGHAGALLLGVLLSLLLLFGAAVACVMLARSEVFPFVLAEVMALSISAAIFGVRKLIRK